VIDELSQPKISVIVLTYQAEAWIEACLRSLSCQSFDDFEIVLADNASTDNTLEVASKTGIPHRVVRNDVNLGYSAGNNQAAAVARGAHLLFLNPDTRCEENCLRELVAMAPRTAIVAAHQLTYDGSGELSCGMPVDIFAFPLPPASHSRWSRPFYADGAALFIARDDFTRLGGFDEDYFLFAEDLDLSWRARLVGYAIVGCPRAIVYHESGGTAGGGGIAKSASYQTTTFRRYLGERNIQRTILKNFGLGTLLWLVPLYLLQFAVELLVLTAVGSVAGALADLRALLWNASHLRGTLWERQKVQASRTVPDRQILSDMYKGSSKLLLLKTVGVPLVKKTKIPRTVA